MAPRSFTVYCDSPVDTETETNTKASLAPKPAILAASSPNIAASSTTLLASTTEKENLHPITGERCAAPSDPITTKKRKTTVLATKTIVAKKHKESKEDRPEGKKTRSASSSAKGRKDAKSTRKSGKKVSRRVSPLPKLEEEETAVDRATQSNIDSRCYELTVSPLADVTQAYDARFDVNSLLASFTSEETAQFRKATSTEPELRDYFSPSHSSGSSARITPSASGADDTKVFSTPERRHIYSAFTFTTPSPSSERFRKASRSPSVPRLNLSPSAATATST
ncbi:hypothetical protein B0H15DRAFT_927720 [Mycena belliarum]|uniref:Uncharacterized protein n=1 Tax=Mycena belliarum TaxID=1033014 RepID=A0AAD6UE05_9AGAR|nr:hypothetical protein B0H15DRAFT_927720 [Mycena belliae]